MSDVSTALTLAGAIPEDRTAFAPGEEAAAVLTNGTTGQQYLDKLLERELFPDAARFLAALLPKRQAVWWACQCAKRFYGAEAPPKIAMVLQATLKWVADPNDENRRAAMTAAEAVGMDNPASCAAMGAFFSGGSMGPANVQAIPPPEHMTAKVVAGAVVLCAVGKEPEKAADKFRASLSEGLEIAKRSGK